MSQSLSTEYKKLAWSPAKAKVNRSRSKQAKLQLDLSAHIKGPPEPNSPVKSPKKKALDEDEAMREKVEKEIAKLPQETRKLLEIIRNENKIYTVKERVEAEVELNKDPDTAQVMRDMKYIDGRVSLLNLKEKTEAEQQQIMADLIKEEEKREAEEQAEFKKNRDEKRREEKERVAKLKKAQRDAKTQAADTRAKDAEDLRKIAEGTKAKVSQKIQDKAQQERDHEARKKDLLKDEDDDVLRALKEARLDQQETKY